MGWFLGVTERQLLGAEARRDLFAGGCFVNPETGRQWPTGRFECVTIAELSRRVAELPACTPLGSPDVPLGVRRGVDIGSLQASMKTEDRAMVQIASNFNCLEVPSRASAPDSGRLVTGYATDSTQGPAASFGVPAACLLRAHYPFHDESTDPKSWGQTRERQVELLANVRRYFGTCENGKLTLGGDEEIVGPETLEDVVGQIKVGLHEDAQVVFGRSSDTKRGTIEVLSDPPLVDQLLSASVCLPDPGEYRSRAQLKWLMRAALRACYQGTYMAAILRQRRVLLLTLVGGGVFGNPEGLVLEELALAHRRWAGHPASCLCEVRICLYSDAQARTCEELLPQRMREGGAAELPEDDARSD